MLTQGTKVSLLAGSDRAADINKKIVGFAVLKNRHLQCRTTVFTESKQARDDSTDIGGRVTSKNR